MQEIQVFLPSFKAWSHGGSLSCLRGFLWCPFSLPSRTLAIFLSFPPFSFLFPEYPFCCIFDPPSFSYLWLKFTSRRKSKHQLGHWALPGNPKLQEKLVMPVLCGLGLSWMTSLTSVWWFHSCVGEPPNHCFETKANFAQKETFHP